VFEINTRTVTVQVVQNKIQKLSVRFLDFRFNFLPVLYQCRYSNSSTFCS